MRKFYKNALIGLVAFVIVFSVCACANMGDKDCKTAETVTLQNIVLSEVEFENSDTVELKQECENVEISGKIDAMTSAQKNAYGDNSVSHSVGIKIEFDKERTLSYVEIKGQKTKVYSTNNKDANYVGGLTDLLDNEAGEDAYANIILSANTSDYTIKIKYTDGKEAILKIEISATLATAESE